MQFIELLQSSPGFFYVAVGLLGLVIGSFLNVVIVRLPVMMERDWRRDCCSFLKIDDNNQDQDERFNLLHPPSQCPVCHQPIALLENIPLLSYFFLAGKCATCQASISLRYPLVELLTCLLTLVVALHFGARVETLFACLLVWALIALSFIDLDKQLLPDEITLPLLWSGILCNLFGIFEQTLKVNLHTSIIGCIIGYLILWGVFHVFRIITGKEGMGYGDFKLLAALGAWLGWPYIPGIILLSSATGALVGIAMILCRHHTRETPIPFGPYLALAGFINLIWGPKILSLTVNLS